MYVAVVVNIQMNAQYIYYNVLVECMPRKGAYRVRYCRVQITSACLKSPPAIDQLSVLGCSQLLLITQT